MKIRLLALFICLSSSAFCQFENGSFEIDGDPILEPWIDQCGHGNSFMDASPQGGDWCLQLIFGNTQGCYPAYFYQVLPDIQTGTFLKIRGEARTVIANTPASMFIGKMDLEGQITTLFSDTTTSPEWEELIVEGEIELLPGETAVIVLQSGLTGGPAGLDHYAFFDDIEILEPSTTSTNVVSNFPEILFPNPVSETLPIWTKDGTASITGLTLFTATGKELFRMQYQNPQSRMELYLAEFAPGPYFLLLYSEDSYHGYWVLKI